VFWFSVEKGIAISPPSFKRPMASSAVAESMMEDANAGIIIESRFTGASLGLFHFD
jgi:hypothetical protein